MKAINDTATTMITLLLLIGASTNAPAEAAATKSLRPRTSTEKWHELHTNNNHHNNNAHRNLYEMCNDKSVNGGQAWYDSDGPDYHCAWYAQNPRLYCLWYGNDFQNFGLTANQACCVCGNGGGDIVDVPMRHVPNTYCESYDRGNTCNGVEGGRSFDDVWRQCLRDGSDTCGGVMWSPCNDNVPTSDTSGKGAWHLMTAGQDIGTANRPTSTCGGSAQALGHWDVYARVKHVPNTYCQYYRYGGDGDCSVGRSFFDVWRECDQDGPDVCQGVMWNSCTGPTSKTSVNGAWKLMRAGQDIGDADRPTSTCGGKSQALGHWDVFLRYE